VARRRAARIVHGASTLPINMNHALKGAFKRAHQCLGTRGSIAVIVDDRT
jgi:hypothetical protein